MSLCTLSGTFWQMSLCQCRPCHIARKFSLLTFIRVGNLNYCMRAIILWYRNDVLPLLTVSVVNPFPGAAFIRTTVRHVPALYINWCVPTIYILLKVAVCLLINSFNTELHFCTQSQYTIYSTGAHSLCL